MTLAEQFKKRYTFREHVKQHLRVWGKIELSTMRKFWKEANK